MKIHPKFGLVALAIAQFATGSAFAGDLQLQAIDNHHGAYIYMFRPAPSGTTIAFGGHAKGTGGTTTKPTKVIPTAEKSSFREFSTPHGTVSYFAPAE